MYDVATREALAYAAGYLAGLRHRDHCEDPKCHCRPAAPDPYRSPRAHPFGNSGVKHEEDDEDLPLDRWK